MKSLILSRNRDQAFSGTVIAARKFARTYKRHSRDIHAKILPQKMFTSDTRRKTPRLFEPISK